MVCNWTMTYLRPGVGEERPADSGRHAAGQKREICPWAPPRQPLQPENGPASHPLPFSPGPRRPVRNRRKNNWGYTISHWTHWPFERLNLTYFLSDYFYIWNTFYFPLFALTFIYSGGLFCIQKRGKSCKKGPCKKNGSLVQKNGSLTDFSYNSLISYETLDM